MRSFSLELDLFLGGGGFENWLLPIKYGFILLIDVWVREMHTIARESQNFDTFTKV